MMTQVLLYGPLRARFGKRWMLDVESPAEAIRALCSQAKGFRQHLIEHSKPGYHVLVGDADIGAAENLAIGAGGRTIKIIPVAQGGKDAIWTILIGVALIAFSMGTFGAGFAATAFAGTTVGAIAGSIGVSLVLGGVAQLLFSPPSASGPTRDDAGTPSYAFSGPVNTSAQGHPVPICYGRLRVGSCVISAAFHTAAYGSDSGGDQLAITVASPYTWTSGTIPLTASGGTSPYTWDLLDDAGVFTIGSDTLGVVGSPVGAFHPTVRVTDSEGESVEQALEILCGGADPTPQSYGPVPSLRKV